MRDPVVNIRSTRWSNYVIAFGITALIFATALYASNYFNNRRIADIRATQDTISTDILSLETQFDLLQERSCTDIAENTVLPGELQTLANQLSYMEGQGFTDQDEVVRLKRLYSLLEIKDYLLMKQFAVRCGLKPIFILYFYSNTGDCDDCQKQGYALTSLARNYPQLRIYSFDYDLDVSALQTLISINDIEDTMPALIINGKVYYGYHSVADIEKILPQLAVLKKAAAATSTPVKK
ncbi:MAG: thioredoxin family protein [bacterium]|nr:thioredoxin family protein [bacterium]